MTTDQRALRRIDPEHSGSNNDPDCGYCHHRWHGLPCSFPGCSCSSAWIDPDRYWRDGQPIPLH